MGRFEARRFNRAMFWLWLGPGLVASWFLRESVPWVVGMSWWAIVVSHLAGWRADEPNPE
jgi:hypothetical protein